jgi:methionine-gamma-lyase
MKNKKQNLNTLFVHSGSGISLTKIRTANPPIFQTTNFLYDEVESGTDILVGKKPGYIYSRYSNPTVDALNQVLAQIEDGERALSFASGLNAISTTFLAYCRPGDHIVASALIYGGTYHLLRSHLKRMNINTTFVNPLDIELVKNSVRPNTRILFTEPLANPTLESSDILKWADIAQSSECKLIVDNTFTPPPIFQPRKYGVDVVIHSATKYLGGHSDVIGGSVISSQEEIDKIYPHFKYHGGMIAPFSAWLILRGIRTLGIRLERQCASAFKIAQYLEIHPKVKKVNYAGLSSNAQFLMNKKYFNGFSGMLSFEIKGGFKAAKKFMEKLEIIQFTVSLGDVASLISHPASSSHIYLTNEERTAIGVSDGLLRLSVGIEDYNDLIQDLESAFGGK